MSCGNSKCRAIVFALFLLLISVILLITEVANFLVGSWYTNIFGGVWTSLILCHYSVTIFINSTCSIHARRETPGIVSLDCAEERRLRKYATFSNVLVIVTLIALIVFDIIFLSEPQTCFFASNCLDKAPLIESIGSIFGEDTPVEFKRTMFIIQLNCAGLSLFLCIVYFRRDLTRNKNDSFDRLPSIRSAPLTLPSISSSTIDRGMQSAALKSRKQLPMWSTTNPVTFRISHAPPF